jgi:hypothetical protein
VSSGVVGRRTRRPDGDDVDRDIDRARQPGDIGRCQRAAGVDTVRHDDDDSPLRLPFCELLGGLCDRVIQRGKAPTFRVVQCRANAVTIIREGCFLTDDVVEREQRRFVGRVIQLIEQFVDDGLCVAQIRPSHAPARVEEHREADRSAIGRAEVDDSARLAVFEYLEVVLLQCWHDTILAVAHDGGDRNECDARAECRPCVLGAERT